MNLILNIKSRQKVELLADIVDIEPKNEKEKDNERELDLIEQLQYKINFLNDDKIYLTLNELALLKKYKINISKYKTIDKY